MAKKEFYPMDFDYDNEGNILIYGKTTSNEKILIIDDSVKPYFYVLENGNKAKEIENIRIKEENKIYRVSKTEIVNKRYYDKEIKAVKVYVDHHRDINHIRKKLRDSDLAETDIRYIKRYLTEKRIDPLVLSEAEGEIIEDTDEGISIQGEVKQKSSEFLKNPRILAFDIEVYGDFSGHQKHKQDPIIMISFKGEEFNKVITWKKINAPYVETVKNEKELLEKFVEVIQKYNPDYITGYFTDGFDFPYIKLRADELDVKMDLGIDKSLLIIKKEKTGFTSAKIKGIPHLDMYRFVSRIMGGGLRIDTFNLNTVAREILGEKKLDFDLGDISEVWDSGDIKELAEYNLRDSDLAYKLCRELLPNLNELSKLVGMPIYDVCRATYGSLVENYLIKKAKDYNEIIPNRPKYDAITERRNETYEGAFVMEPKPGFYDKIVVYDFKSIYPSIIVTKNISPSSLNSSKGNKTPEVEIKGKKRHYYFDTKETFIPKVVKELILKRNDIKKQLKEKKDSALSGRSYALKTVANAIYGYLGFFGSRYHSMECAASITAWARYYIQDVIKKAQKEKFEVIYSDTDSIAIFMNKKTKKESLDFLEKVNKNLPGIMELELENFYDYGLFVSKKGEESSGAKKKYALIDSKGEIKIIGFETVRGDWSLIARETQKKVIEIILKENSFEKALNYARKVIKELNEGRVDMKKLIIRNQLKMDLEKYKQIGPHVAVAKQMRERGVNIREGSMINYIVCSGKGLIRDRSKIPKEARDYDKDYYINNQVIPCVEKIFEIKRYTKQDLLSKEQSKLGDF
ncbi:hypothetical protein J4406_02315 [Candidatus Woesearchaeota archaeon]|nr:hypothetical protein [Candidatus Woesearchaeota archaeon]